RARSRGAAPRAPGQRPTGGGGEGRKGGMTGGPPPALPLQKPAGAAADGRKEGMSGGPPHALPLQKPAGAVADGRKEGMSGGPPPALPLQTPALALELLGPEAGAPGQPLVYEIRVRNAGTVPARLAPVDPELPPGTRLLHADPPPAVEGDRLKWVVDQLTPGDEQRFRVQLQP